MDFESVAQGQNFDAAELHRIGVASKADVAAGSILARVRRVGHEFADGRQVGIEDSRAVEFDDNLRSGDFDPFVVPLSGGAQITSLGRCHSVGAAVGLSRVDAFVICVPIIEDLQFGHADISGIAVPKVFGELFDFLDAWVADCNPVVTSRWQLEIEAEDEVAVAFFGVQNTSLALHALDGTFADGVVSSGTFPAGQVRAVEKNVELRSILLDRFGFGFVENLVGLGVGVFLDRDIAETDFASVGLELDRSALDQGLAWGEEIVQPGIGDDRFAVEPNPAAFSDQTHLHGVPLADGVIGPDHRVLAGPTRWVIPQATAPFFVSVPAIVLCIGIPDLDLGDASEVDARVTILSDFVIERELKISVVSVGREVSPFSIVDDFVAFDFPMVRDFLVPFGFIGFGSRFPFARVDRGATMPAA